MSWTEHIKEFVPYDEHEANEQAQIVMAVNCYEAMNEEVPEKFVPKLRQRVFFLMAHVKHKDRVDQPTQIAP